MWLQLILIIWLVGAVFWSGYYSNYIWGVWFDEPGFGSFDKHCVAIWIFVIIFISWFPLAFFIYLPKPELYQPDSYDLDYFGQIDWPQPYKGEHIESSKN